MVGEGGNNIKLICRVTNDIPGTCTYSQNVRTSNMSTSYLVVVYANGGRSLLRAYKNCGVMLLLLLEAWLDLLLTWATTYVNTITGKEPLGLLAFTIGLLSKMLRIWDWCCCLAGGCVNTAWTYIQHIYIYSYGIEGDSKPLPSIPTMLYRAQAIIGRAANAQSYITSAASRAGKASVVMAHCCMVVGRHGVMHCMKT